MFSRNQVHILRDRIVDLKCGHSLAHAMNGSGYLLLFIVQTNAAKPFTIDCSTAIQMLIHLHNGTELTEMKSMNHTN